MENQLSAGQLERLSNCHKAFNRLTGKRWSFQKYLQFVIEQAIAGEEASAHQSQPFAPVVRGGVYVH